MLSLDSTLLDDTQQSTSTHMRSVVDWIIFFLFQHLFFLLVTVLIKLRLSSRCWSHAAHRHGSTISLPISSAKQTCFNNSFYHANNSFHNANNSFYNANNNKSNPLTCNSARAKVHIRLLLNQLLSRSQRQRSSTFTTVDQHRSNFFFLIFTPFFQPKYDAILKKGGVPAGA